MVRSRTGLKSLKARVKCRGLDVVDKRTSAAKSLLRWKSQLLSDLGGEQTVSAQRMALVEVSVRTLLYINHVDGWLVEQEHLIVGRGRKKVVLPVLLQRQQLCDSLARMLGHLGLDRVEKRVPSLAEYLEGKDHDNDSEVDGRSPTTGEDVQEEMASGR